MFPILPEQLRFTCRQLHGTITPLRQMVLTVVDVVADAQCVIDSLPIEALASHLLDSSSEDWAAYGPHSGTVHPRKRTLSGYRLTLLLTLGGAIV